VGGYTNLVQPFAEKRFLYFSAKIFDRLKTNTIVFVISDFASNKFLSGGCA
jgi:hypothetical protein